MNLWLWAGLAGLAFFFLVLMVRPSLVWLFFQTLILVPVQAFFALLRMPAHHREFLTAAIAAKHAQALNDHAQAATALWNTNSEFRPAAKELFNRMLMGYGIRPAGVDAEPKPKSYSEGRVAQVANIVNDGHAVARSKGSPEKSA